MGNSWVITNQEIGNRAEYKTMMVTEENKGQNAEDYCRTENGIQ